MGRNERAFAIPLLCGIIGILLAIMLQFLNDAEILVDEFITATLTIREVQYIVIIVWIIIGVGVSAIEN